MSLKKIIILIIFTLLFFFTSQNIYAQSQYVLPYPSYMPGSLFYRPHLLFEIVSAYWYFGNLGQFKYNLKESDKYLVESKTLFEYDQFIYATRSLSRSNDFFIKTTMSLSKANKEGKDISSQNKLLKSAVQKHIEVLKKLEESLPETFNWSPEKGRPTTIFIKKDIENAISVRQKYL